MNMQVTLQEYKVNSYTRILVLANAAGVHLHETLLYMQVQLQKVRQEVAMAITLSAFFFSHQSTTDTHVQ